MGVRLEWEVEAERERTRHSEEDPETVRQRRRARSRAVLVVLIFLGVIGAGIGTVIVRLGMVTTAEEDLLRATVAAEVAALRVGDLDAFLAVQRSATDDWLQRQGAAFRAYQAAILQTDIQLTGTIRAVDYNDRTARVLVEEQVGGQIIVRPWFYWRYDDGWFHVLPDYTFWGAPGTINGQRVTVSYRALDAEFAGVLHQAVEAWLAIGCEAVGCTGLPTLAIEVVGDEFVTLSETLYNPLIVPSPYIAGYRPAQPLPRDQAVTIAELIAERLVSDALPDDPLYPADAYYLRQAAISWLVGRMAATQTNSFLIASIADRYGISAVGTMLRGLAPTADLGALPALLGAVDVAALDLDWRDYLTWRLALERDFTANGDSARFMALYDPTNPALTVVAQARLQAGIPADRFVVSARQSVDVDGVPQVRTLVQVGADPSAQEEVNFRLINSLWLRAN